jgi:hypothetical protein
MPDDRDKTSSDQPPREQDGDGEQSPRSASQDLAAGLDLMLRAAKKAMRNIDPTKIESLGRRAVQGLENLDRKKVGELGRKAAKNLDPRRIEEIAEDAGRELLSVVERVAERVESAVGGAPARGSSQAPGADRPADPEPGDSAEQKPRVRIEDER